MAYIRAGGELGLIFSRFWSPVDPYLNQYLFPDLFVTSFLIQIDVERFLLMVLSAWVSKWAESSKLPPEHRKY